LGNPKKGGKIMFKSRRSQAALEFLMTYGWAILVVLIVISALAYFGVMNPQRLLPSRCTLPMGVSCKDFVVKSAGNVMNLNILNGLGSGILITSIDAAPATGNPTTVDCSVDNSTTVWITGKNGIHLSNSESKNFNLDCTPIDAAFVTSGQKYRWDLIVTYYLDDSDVTYAKSLQGELFTTIEP
jgi:hypothetical protein